MVSKRRAALFLLMLVLLFPSHVPAGEPVRIASIFAHTGAAGIQNTGSIMGVRFAIRELNDNGGLLGRKLELIELDNKSTPIGSKVAADEAVKADVAAIIGADWSSHSLAVARVAQANGIPMISNISTNPEVTRVGDYIFRVCYTDPFQGRVMARFSREHLGAQSAVVFVDITSDYSMGLAAVLRQSFEEMGGRVLLDLQYKHRQEDFRDLVLRAKNVQPDVLLFSGHDESALILKEALRAGLTATAIGGDGFGTDSFHLKGGSELERAYYCTHLAAELADERSRRFVARYGNGPALTSSEATSYDAVMVLADALRRAGSAERNRIREALASTKNFQGVTGRITFDGNGDPIKGAVIMEIRYGRRAYFRSIQPEG
ncbi:MAG: ABC transporter substrate-binding protein [Deltaproteobacteria bacterium]|nr:ABC transporter substrate-binding protein [Deltaproteobacteria bacterium]